LTETYPKTAAWTTGDIVLTLIPVEDAPKEIPTLIYDTLYLNWNVDYEPTEGWYDGQKGGRFLVARKPDGTLLGVCRLMPVDPETPDGIQIRQVVVTAASQGMGIGSKLMRECEEIGRAEGAKELFLWSRKPAYLFYENLGYQYQTEPWYSPVTKMHHRTMTKAL